MASDTQPSLIVLAAAPLVPSVADSSRSRSLMIRASWTGDTNILRSAAHDQSVM
jgi:hypothetical protein